MNRVDNTTGAAASKDRPLAGDNAPIRDESRQQRLVHLFRKYGPTPVQDVLYSAALAHRSRTPQ